jgi:hypothetical protein
MSTLNVKNLYSFWRRKLSNVIRQFKLYSFFPRKHDVQITVELLPFFIGQFKMLPQNGFSSLIFNRQGLCEVMKSSGDLPPFCGPIIM